jgi:thioredoxin 1
VNALILTGDNFDAETAAGLVMVDFWAPRCPPCRKLGPVISKVAAATKGKAKVCKCDVDEWPAIAARYGVKGIPVIVILRDGKEVERLQGYQDEEVLLVRLEAHTR